MTQEKAREFLMNKKVFVKNKGKEVQEKLFNLGFKWAAPEEKGVYKDRYFLFLYGDLTAYVDIDDIEYFYEHEFKEISAEDILSIEIERLPKTWEEFCEKNPVKKGEAAIVCDSEIYTIQHLSPRLSKLDRDILPNSSAAKAHLALMQLHQLRNCYRGDSFSVYCYSIIRISPHHFMITRATDRFLSFPTEEMAKEFLSNFKDLIEEAGDLI